jgi:excisionase family DNA binding protein
MSDTKETKIDANLELNKNRLLTEKQASAYIGISYESLKRSIRWNGKIPFYRVNKRISYRVRDLDEFMEQCRVPAKN